MDIKPTHKKNSVITIFQDPVTETKIEGRAKLIKFISTDGVPESLERWKVRFLYDGEKAPVYERWLKKQ